MKIKLVGALPWKLRDMGFKAGMEFNAEASPIGRLGAVTIRHINSMGEEITATVYKENYKRL